MGATYDVKLTLKYKNRKKAEEGLLNYVWENFMDEHPASMETVMENLLLLDSVGDSFEHEMIDENTEYYGTTVEKAYSFESTILNVFRSMKDHLLDGSSLEIYPDSGYERYHIQDGAIKNFYVDEMLNPFFDSAEAMYEDIESREGYGYYNTYTHTYVFYDDRKGKLCHVDLEETDIPRICKEMREDSDLEKWQYFIDPSMFCWEDDEDAAVAYLQEINDTPCTDKGLPKAEECWVVASDCTEYYC